MGRLVGRLFVSLTVLLISFIGYSSQIFIIWPWYGYELSVELISLLSPFNALLYMLWWNYYLCVNTDPGQVPKTWKPDVHGDEGYEVKKLTRAPRFCRNCESYKPPRAHHCRQCKRCVLRMDHHCPWVNNCVGHFNHGHFIRFLFYVDVACSYHLFMVTRRVYSVMSERFWDDPSTSEIIFIILNYTLCIPVLLAVGGFSIYHFNALMNNTTTIEGWEKDKAATLVRRGKIQEIRFPYNIGRRKNISSVLGDSPSMWCWPTVTPGNGLKFTVVDSGGGDAEDWPPKDPGSYLSVADDEDYVLDLPSSPWTYANGNLNPDLQPPGARVSSLSKRRKARAPNGDAISAVPPYHPDYRPPGDDEEDFSDFAPSANQSSDEESDRPGQSRRFIRRGSEGYEVQVIDREAMLRRHVVSQVTEPGRYNVYMPDPPSESDNEDEAPLASRVEDWRAETSVAAA